jgi:hypothetical protein
MADITTQLKSQRDLAQLNYNLAVETYSGATITADQQTTLNDLYQKFVAAKTAYGAVNPVTPIIVNALQEGPAAIIQTQLPPPVADPTTLAHLDTINNATSTPSAQTMASAAASHTDALNSSGLTGDFLAQAQAAIAPLNIFTGAPMLVSQMTDHIKNISFNQVQVYNAASQQVDPNNKNNPNKCANMSDYFGTMQGKYSSALSTISSGISKIMSAISSVTSSVINGISSAINAITTAIQTGINDLIKVAVGGLSLAMGAFTKALGAAGSLISGVSNAIGSVASAVKNEASNISSAIGKQLSGPFLSAISNSNPCMKAAQTTTTATTPLLVGANGLVAGPV